MKLFLVEKSRQLVQYMLSFATIVSYKWKV